MAKGLPLFLSDIPSLRDVGANHAIFFDLNSPEAAANKIKHMISNPKELFEMGSKAREYAKNIGSKGAYINNILNIYKKVIS